MKAFVIVFILSMTSVTEKWQDDILVQFGGALHWYETIEECKSELAELDGEHLINEFISQSHAVDPTILFESSEPALCTLYKPETGQYPDYPAFDIPMEDPLLMGPNLDQQVLN